MSGEWKTIDSAPSNTAVIATDGTVVGEACLIDYGNDVLCGWYWASDRNPMSTKVTHWMPLPKPPSDPHACPPSGRE